MREVVEAASKGQTVKMISQRTGSGKRARNTAVSRFTAEEPTSDLATGVVRRTIMAIGRTYFTCDSASLGLMTMSYFGRVAERCSRASYGFISLAATRTPSGYAP